MLASLPRPKFSLDPLIAEARRRARKRRALLALALAVAVLAMWVGGVAPPGRAGKTTLAAATHHTTFRQQVLAIARELAHHMDYHSVKAAKLYGPASYQAAFRAFSNGPTTTDRRKGRFYIVALQGHTAAIWRLWSPRHHGFEATGFRRRLPATLSQLGSPTLLKLR
ncbi:MAG TPA: hypothetical protein VFV91_11155 [Gaiellaceae bacterium]|jgi:hypothetical protein|nr:hypothetical protein [Gaiellaceae bacterium]